MICAVTQFLPEHFVFLWLASGVGAGLAVLLGSGISFCKLYKPDYKLWLYKSNARYPTAQMVRAEILQTYKGVFFASIFPALSLHYRDSMLGYCPAQVEPSDDANSFAWVLARDSLLRVALEIILIVTITDFFEFIYHWCGHFFDLGWSVHRHHHHFSNPTPWAVVADEPFDNLVRATPLFFLPLFFPLNLNTLFMTFVIFFYSYGIYLHCGFEADWLVPSDHKWINTSFQHYVHHNKGTRSRPCHCGFFIKLWDQILGTEYDGPECYAKTEREKGMRTKEIYETEVLSKFPNYALLREPKFLLFGEKHPSFAGRLVVDARPSAAEEKKEQ
jgi:lathosterol oxidase